MRAAPDDLRPPGFVYRQTSTAFSLYGEKLAFASLAKRFDTPLYVYSSAALGDRVDAFHQAFRHTAHTLCYSVKANSNLSILRLLAKLGCGFDVVSGGELERVLRAGGAAAARNTVFSGVGKTKEEMRAALKAGILLFNVESDSELEELAECASDLRITAPVALRVNPDVSARTHPYISTGLRKHKFGVPIADALRLYSIVAKNRYLKISGVSVHIGSQIRDAGPFGQAMRRVAEVVRQLRERNHRIPYVDAGGGLGIDYENMGDFSRTLSKYAKAVTGPLTGLGVHLLLEPGRSIVGQAGILLTRVLHRKTNDGKTFVIVDAAMNDLIRPALYNAHHEIVPVIAKPRAPWETVDVVGPVCETGDFLARDRSLPKVQKGDLLAILDAGAYGMSLASNYNTRPRPAEVLIEGKSARLIRRRETVAHLLRQELH